MYHFAILALIALATIKVVDFVGDNVPQLHGLRTPLTFFTTVVTVIVLDYSVFAGWGVAVDNADFGVWVTGFMAAGMTVPWRAVFGYLTHDRATSDETLGDHTSLRRAA